jgi:predicted RNA binding protein YcfA (HicA-like mRNA interferase family)
MKLPRVSGQDCVKALEKAGFKQIRQHGSHIIMRKTDPLIQLVVPDHRAIDRGTLKAIIRQSGLTTEQFHQYL